MPINLVTWKSLFQHSLAVQIRNLIRFCEHVWDWGCVCEWVPVCHYVCMWVWLRMCVCENMCECPWRLQPDHRSERERERAPSQQLPALSAVSSSCYGSSSEGCIHGQRRKLASPNNRPSTPPLLLVSPRQAPDPLVNLPGGRRSMAQSCRVTVRDDEGENEKERSCATQMGRRDEKMKRWDQIWLLSRGGGCGWPSRILENGCCFARCL